MSTTHKYATPNSIEQLITTDLNSLANGSRAVSAAVNNDSGLYLYGDIECNFGSAAFAAGAYVSVYILESIDGTNYEDGSSSVTPTAQALLCTIPFRNATAAQIHTMRGLVLPPCKFKILVINNTGVTLAASGNVVSLVRYNEQDV